jgi:16S rRNA (cytidine1402-2'-O)-methyltransferase
VTGLLTLVATPIGNLDDITLRALRVLREAELVLAEDTRHTRVLFSHHAIATPLGSLHAHSSEGRVAQLADALAAGARYALVSDAGTPLVSDPGRELVEAAVARGVRVEAAPGASAVLTALCVAGIPAERFRFVGFLPKGGRRRREALARVAQDPYTSVIYEAPSRLAETLSDLGAVCGAGRTAAVCRELTKLHEDVQRGTLAELAALYDEGARGEICIVVQGASLSEASDDDAALSDDDIDALIRERLAAGTSAKDAARQLAAELGLDKRDAYKRVLAIKGS